MPAAALSAHVQATQCGCWESCTCLLLLPRCQVQAGLVHLVTACKPSAPAQADSICQRTFNIAPSIARPDHVRAQKDKPHPHCPSPAVRTQSQPPLAATCAHVSMCGCCRLLIGLDRHPGAGASLPHHNTDQGCRKLCPALKQSCPPCKWLARGHIPQPNGRGESLTLGPNGLPVEALACMCERGVCFRTSRVYVPDILEVRNCQQSSCMLPLPVYCISSLCPGD